MCSEKTDGQWILLECEQNSAHRRAAGTYKDMRTCPHHVFGIERGKKLEKSTGSRNPDWKNKSWYFPQRHLNSKSWLSTIKTWLFSNFCLCGIRIMAGFEKFCQKIICMQTIVEISYLSLSALIKQVIESFGKMRKLKTFVLISSNKSQFSGCFLSCKTHSLQKLLSRPSARPFCTQKMWFIIIVCYIIWSIYGLSQKIEKSKIELPVNEQRIQKRP